MAVGRVVAGVVVFVLATFFGFKGPGPVPFVQGAIVTGLAGILIQLVFVPPVAKLLKKHVSRA